MKEAGVCKFYNQEKSFGFITRKEGGDVFFHRSDLDASGIQTLTENQPVYFEVVAGREGRPKAQNISIGLP